MRRKRLIRSNLINKKDERGAALVESALVFLPLMTLVFGMIEYGFIFKDMLTLSSASRAGVRTAAAATGSSPDSFFPATAAATRRAASATDFTDEDQMWIYLADSNGDPAGDKTCGAGMGNSRCIVYHFDGTDWIHTGETFLWDPRTANTCLGNGGLDAVGIRITSHYDPITELFPLLNNTVLVEKSVMNFEPSSSVLKDCK